MFNILCILLICFIVLDYGDKENSDIAERYGVSKDNFPVLKLFVEGKSEPFTYSGDFKADEIRNFIKQHSSMYLFLHFYSILYHTLNVNKTIV